MSTPVQAPAGQQPAESAGRRAIWLSIAALAMTFMLPLAGLVMALFALAAGIRALPLLKAASKPTGIAVEASPSPRSRWRCRPWPRGCSFT